MWKTQKLITRLSKSLFLSVVVFFFSTNANCGTRDGGGLFKNYGSHIEQTLLEARDDLRAKLLATPDIVLARFFTISIDRQKMIASLDGLTFIPASGPRTRIRPDGVVDYLLLDYDTNFNRIEVLEDFYMSRSVIDKKQALISLFHEAMHLQGLTDDDLVRLNDERVWVLGLAMENNSLDNLLYYLNNGGLKKTFQQHELLSLGLLSQSQLKSFLAFEKNNCIRAKHFNDDFISIFAKATDVKLALWLSQSKVCPFQEGLAAIEKFDLTETKMLLKLLDWQNGSLVKPFVAESADKSVRVEFFNSNDMTRMPELRIKYDGKIIKLSATDANIGSIIDWCENHVDLSRVISNRSSCQGFANNISLSKTLTRGRKTTTFVVEIKNLRDVHVHIETFKNLWPLPFQSVKIYSHTGTAGWLD